MTCRPTSAHPRPVVLVRGTGGNRSTYWQTYGRNATVHVVNALDPAHPRPVPCVLVLPSVGGLP